MFARDDCSSTTAVATVTEQSGTIDGMLEVMTIYCNQWRATDDRR